MRIYVFLGLEDKLLQLGMTCKIQSIALEILHRSFPLRSHLRSTAQATEITKGQGLYSRFGDFR